MPSAWAALISLFFSSKSRMAARSFFSTAGVSLYVLGGISALAAFLTGRAAADSVFLSTEANEVLTRHADMGEYTFYFFGAFALVRLGLAFTPMKDKMPVRGLLTVIGLAGQNFSPSTIDLDTTQRNRQPACMAAID